MCCGMHDTLVLKDLKRFFDIEIESVPFGAVGHAIRGEATGIAMFAKEYNVALAHYFNAGVLLVNRVLWLRENITEKSIAFILKYQPTTVDQDALNYICANNFKILDSNFNDTSNVKNKNAVIIHFISKPLKLG